MEKTQISWLEANCDYFREPWGAQTNYGFGFVPLTKFLLPNTSIANGLSLECPISQHMKIQKWACLNFMGTRIPVQSELNISAWEEVLVD